MVVSPIFLFNGFKLIFFLGVEWGHCDVVM